MLIAIDMQGAQASNANRGIGRYTLALTRALVRGRKNNDVLLILNSAFPASIETIRAEFEGELTAENILVWSPPGFVDGSVKDNSVRRQAGELIRETYINRKRPDIVLNVSIFEGYGDDAITSIGMFEYIETAVLLHDLIPLIHDSVYLRDENFKRWYLNKLDHLRRADLVLTNSQSTAREAIEYLGFPLDRVANISSACDDSFKVIPTSLKVEEHLKKAYRLARPFLMYTGGIDFRKNIEGLIRAFAQLPDALRSAHQLAIVCSVQKVDRLRLLELAKSEGLIDDDVVITGYVSDEDLVSLYNACCLFVFPSWHEGFGLPALEAMACGKPVIAANTSSLPEVLNCPIALFEAHNDRAIAEKIEEVLLNPLLIERLSKHGLTQAKNFSWEKTATAAWRALENHLENKISNRHTEIEKSHRPKLAYVSPMPPGRTGIADYSAELLPELSRFYEVEVVTPQFDVDDGWVEANSTIRDVEWFLRNHSCFDRVLYHFGNSDYHSHMFKLLELIPGVVVLHDFFLSGIVAHRDVHEGATGSWPRELLQSHGWVAVESRYKAKDTAEVVWKYPTNLSVLNQALGVIVHSEFSRNLASRWYDKSAGEKWRKIPLLRVPKKNISEKIVRERFGIGDSDFVVCSFGMLGKSKLNDRLLAAWFLSPLCQDKNCHLIFVGQNPEGDYGLEISRSIRATPSVSHIEITGWVDVSSFRDWLAIADVGVQLRSLSRGESSAAVLDCMNYGLATIVNANGSMAEFPDDAVWMLDDQFSDQDLVNALTVLRDDRVKRASIAEKGLEHIRKFHRPRDCAAQYYSAIEGFYIQPASKTATLVKSLSRLSVGADVKSVSEISTSIAENFPPEIRKKQLLLDISELVQRDSRSGIQRVVRALLAELLLRPPEGFSVLPVYATTAQDGYRYAYSFTSQFLNIYDGWTQDEPIDAWAGDVFLGLDLQPVVVPAQQAYLSKLRDRGVIVQFVVYDLLPVLLPHAFPREGFGMHSKWLETISMFDGAICISRAVADEFCTWVEDFAPPRLRSMEVSWFHLGADVENTKPSLGMPLESSSILSLIGSQTTFLMVGTIEPRKGYQLVLRAFEELWAQGADVALVFVGKQGWLVEDLIDEIRAHRENGKRLFWLYGISDEYLEKVYQASNCLICASEGEGFGLPLIEAAQHGLPIISRDLPVFREVAGNGALYFPAVSASVDVAKCVRSWLGSNGEDCEQGVVNMTWLKWSESADQLKDCIVGNRVYRAVKPDGMLRPGVIRSHTSNHLEWSGFGGVERDFRWTDGFESSIRFYADSTTYLDSLIYFKFDSYGSQSFAVMMNDVILCEAVAEGFDLEIFTSANTIVEGLNCLKLIIRSPRQPSSGDSRLLGLAIKKFGLAHSLEFDGSSPRLHSVVGERVDGAMISMGSDGFLLFGPYMPIGKGSYVIEFAGFAEKLVGSEWVDVVCDEGKVTLNKNVVDFTVAGVWHHSIGFQVESWVSDLEFRLYVAAQTKLSIERVVIKACVLQPEKKIALTDAHSFGEVQEIDPPIKVSSSPEPAPIFQGQANVEELGKLIDVDLGHISVRSLGRRGKKRSGRR